MSIISYGGQPYYQQPVRIRTDAQNGNEVEYTWSGRADTLLVDYATLVVGAQVGDYNSPNGSRAEVIARFGNAPIGGGTETPALQFSLRTEEIAQSIYKHPRFTAVLLPATYKLIQDELASNHRYSTSLNTIGLFVNPSQVTSGPNWIAELAAIDLFNLLLAGTDQYEVAQSYTFTMTRTASRGFVINYFLPDDGTLFSTNGLDAYVLSSTTLHLPFSVPTLNAVTSSESLQLVFAWRKRGTDVQYLPNGNTQVTEQWQSARWSLLIYSVSTWG